MAEPQSTLRILLVDDNPDDRTLVARELGREFPALHVEHVVTPEDLERALAAGGFDLVITDYQIRWTDGLAVLRRVKAAFPDCPVVMFTATGGEEIAVEAMKNGLDDYVLKSPKHFRRLHGTVRSVLDKAREHVERRAAEAALAERVVLAEFAAAVGRALAAGGTLQGMLQSAAEAMVRHLGAAFARIWTLDEKAGVLVLRASAGMYTHRDGAHARVPLGRLKIGQIAAQRRPLFTNAVIGDPRVSDQEWARREAMVSFAGHPLIVAGRVVGVMAMFARQPLSEITMRGLAATADTVALGIERKRVEDDLAAALVRAQRSDRLKSAFLANMSHEVRTPLNVILGFTQLLAEYLREGGDSSQQPIVEGILRGGQRLMKTIHGVLDVARLESGEFEARAAVLPLEPLVRSAVREFEAAARDRGLALTTEIDAPEAAVAFDEYCLEQALRALLDNALKFTDSGGVAVRLDRAADGGLRLAVRDTGIGIDEGYLPELFGLFSQEENGYTRRYEGPGIGLALARRFLELNGARITVDSRKGEGSTFTIHFARESEAR